MSVNNRVIMIGNLTKDVELSYTPGKTAVAEFGLGTNRKWKDAQGVSRESACFITVKVWGKVAENCNKYLHKGDEVAIEARLELNTWETGEGKNKVKHYKHYLVADDVRFERTNGKHTREPGEEG